LTRGNIESNGDGEWKTLWDSNDNDGDSNDETIEDVLKVLLVNEFSLFLDEHDAESADDDGNEGQDGDISTQFTNGIGNGVELLLEWGLVRLHVHGESGLSLGSSITDGKNHGSALSGLHKGSLDNEWAWGALEVFLSDDLLCFSVWLSSELRLRAGKVGGGDDKGVSWD
jgi:hypothetical protein